MELKVIEKSKNKIVVDIKEEGYALINSLEKELWNDNDVVSAGYFVEHPLIRIPRLIVETKTKPPEKAIQAAIKRLKKQNAAFLRAFGSAK